VECRGLEKTFRMKYIARTHSTCTTVGPREYTELSNPPRNAYRPEAGNMYTDVSAIRGNGSAKALRHQQRLRGDTSRGHESEESASTKGQAGRQEVALSHPPRTSGTPATCQLTIKTAWRTVALVLCIESVTLTNVIAIMKYSYA